MQWLALIGALALAQTQAPLVFPSSAELVHVVVSVTDTNGMPVAGLQAKDFSVSEDGMPRSVATFAACGDISTVTATECPVDLVFLWDTSTSMLDNLRRARDAAVRFAEKVPAANGRMVVAFDARIRVSTYDPSHPGATFDALLSGEMGGATRLFDAIREGIDRATNDPTRRVIMLALTDGEDSGAYTRPNFAAKVLAQAAPGNFSEVIQSEPVNDVAAALQREGVTFYAIGFSSQLLHEDRQKHANETLRTLAKATGGFVVDGESGDMDSQFDAIRRDLSTQYILGFVPGTSAPGRSHKIRIQIATKDVKVRHRLSYQSR